MAFPDSNRKSWNLTTRKHSSPQLIQNSNDSVPKYTMPRTKSLLTIENIFDDSNKSLLSTLSTEVLDTSGKRENKYHRNVTNLADLLRRPQRMNVTIVVVEAKNLPEAPEDGCAHSIYCKFSLGNESFRTKTIPKTPHPQWKEIFNFTQLKNCDLNITIWDKGKDKHFMGSCVIHLSNLEKEKTHDIWQPLDDEFGSLHLLVTVCGTRHNMSRQINSLQHIQDTQAKYAWYNLGIPDSTVGEVRVTVHGARGLPLFSLGAGPLVLCVLELDNARVQTHAARAAPDPLWNVTYTFDVYDIMSTLDLTICNDMLGNKGEILGKISIPLVRINNGELRWYALKDRNQKTIAKGNCPRILLEMYLVWNPVIASLRLFRPKECKYIKEPAKFDIALVLSNLEFVRDTFRFLVEINEIFKELLEWEGRDHCVVGLAVWLATCYFFELWMVPLVLLIPFFYHWIRLHLLSANTNSSHSPTVEGLEHVQSEKSDKTLKSRIHELHDMTLTITKGIDYLDSVYEKLKNLANFSVPYLSYLVIMILLGGSLVLYAIPVNYILMALGIYKFGRKYLNPKRIPNNDVLDFLTRVPDDDILKMWREFNVPEPVQGAFQKKSRRSFSR